METQGRGMLTQRIKDKSKELLGYEISTKELRLMAYIQYIAVNEQQIDMRSINYDELNILVSYQEAGYLSDNLYDNCRPSKEFWNIICELLYLGYVDLNKGDS